jgi:glycosyltransferase involved in cell wall biosynthesis
VRVAFVYAPELISGRPLDFLDLWASNRGMTGSESSLLIFCRELAKRGHDVALFIEKPNAAEFDGVRLCELGTLPTEAPSLDVVVSYIYSRYLAGVPERVLRVNMQTCNSFDYEEQDFEDSVDLFIAPSQRQEGYMHKWTLTAYNKWKTLRLGCYPDQYDVAPKVPGRCIYTSSPDRGLHLVLQEWPAIRAAVPHASLRIFYHGLDGYLARAGAVPRGAQSTIDNVEQGARARYVAAAIKRLPGVTVVGSSSRETMRREYSEAMVLGYPTDTSAWSEGFSCSTLEGCASGALPVIVACDALGSVYDGVVPMVPAPAQRHMAEWRGLVIKALTDEAWRTEKVAVAREFAAKHDYADITRDLEAMFVQAMAEKKAPPANRPLTDYADGCLAGHMATVEPGGRWQPVRGCVLCVPELWGRMQLAWPGIVHRVPYATLRYLSANHEHISANLAEMSQAACVALPCEPYYEDGTLMREVEDTDILQAMRCGAPVVVEPHPAHDWLHDLTIVANRHDGEDKLDAFVRTVASVLESQPRQWAASSRGARFARRYTVERREKVLEQLK